MPARARSVVGGLVYHVLNRGNGRIRLFHKDEDFAAFERVLGERLERHPVDTLTYYLMGNRLALMETYQIEDISWALQQKPEP